MNSKELLSEEKWFIEYEVELVSAATSLYGRLEAKLIVLLCSLLVSRIRTFLGNYLFAYIQ